MKRIKPMNRIKPILTCFLCYAIGLGAVWGVVFVSATVALQGCAGQAARDHVLAPALAANVDTLKSDAALGAATLPPAEQNEAAAAIARFFPAVASGKRQAILAAMPDWGQVQTFIAKGIDERVRLGQIDSQTRKSFDNQATLFAQGLAKVVEGVSK